MSFAQHQSFYIRFGWITKGLNNINSQDGTFISGNDVYLDLNLGKNMLEALRFWMVSSNLIEKDGNLFKITSLGEIFKQYEINCLRPDTLSIIHYEIVTNPDNAETWYWFFNILFGKKYTKDDLMVKLEADWVVPKNRKISKGSLKRDIDCLVAFYTAKENINDPEDVIFSPFSGLELIKELNSLNKKYFIKNTPKLEKVGKLSLMYILLKFSNKSELTSLSIDTILTEETLWGKVFNFDRQTTIDALNLLMLDTKYPISFIRTNNLDTILLPPVSAEEYLLDKYQGEDNGN